MCVLSTKILYLAFPHNFKGLRCGFRVDAGIGLGSGSSYLVVIAKLLCHDKRFNNVVVLFHYCRPGCHEEAQLSFLFLFLFVNQIWDMSDDESI